jgi:energy-coupling factor transporter ATP-binding protein EcfA2
MQVVKASLARSSSRGSRAMQNRSVLVSGTVLLHGGEGVGKSTLISRVAAALRLRVAMVDGSDWRYRGCMKLRRHCGLLRLTLLTQPRQCSSSIAL